MLKHSDGEKFIDLNQLPPNVEIPIANLFFEDTLKNKQIQNKFSYEEVEVNDASSSIYFTQHQNKILICVYGPREAKFREKAKIEEAVVEVYSKFYYETTRETTKSLNDIIQNFCESLIMLDAYPRCQINIHLNILNVRDSNMLVPTLLNGIMFALSISGIDLKTFGLTTAYSENHGNLVVCLDANKPDKILLLESTTPHSLHQYSDFIQKSKEEIADLFRRFKNVLLKKII